MESDKVILRAILIPDKLQRLLQGVKFLNLYTFLSPEKHMFILYLYMLNGLSNFISVRT